MKVFPAALLIVAAAHFFNMLANSRLFARFAFGDNGWPLVVDGLLDDGLNPVTDFGYFYGLLTLVVDRAFFAVFGRTPDATIGFYGVCALAVAIGMARAMIAVKMKPLPALFFVSTAALGTIPRGFPSTAHALEAALLMTAIAEQVSGRSHRSLALVVLAVFCKPSLGYVYGAVLLALLLRESDRWKKLAPAAILGAILVLGLALRFGWEALLRTQLPFDAMRAYRNEGYGFLFGTGRLFWLPEKPDFDYYFGGVVGTWLIASAVLLISALRSRRRWREPIPGTILTCAVLHFTFVFVLFGNQFTYIYYTYVLFAGCAIGLNGWPRRLRGIVAVGLYVACVCGQSEWLWNRDCWTRNNTGRWTETAGLNAPVDLAREWGEVRRIAEKYPGDRRKALVVTRMGCPQFLAPELDGPHWWCLIEGFTDETELERARDQIRAAEWIISPDWHDNNLMKWKSFEDVLRPFREVPLTYELDDERKPVKSFKVYRRTHP